METNRVRQFCVVAESLNLRKAAEILNMTHGGLFKSIKVLETELGYPLFRKQGRGLVITEQGKELYPKALQFLKDYQAFLSGRDKDNEAIRLGTFEVFSTHFFARWVAPELKQEKFVLQELVPGELEKALLKNQVDIGITYEPVPMQGLQILEVGQLPMGIFGTKKMQQLNFSDWSFVVPAHPIDSPITEVKGLDGWPDHKVHRRVQYEVAMLESALQLCYQGAAVGYFPKPLVSLLNKERSSSQHLFELPKPKGLKRGLKKVYLVLREGAEESVAVKKIAKALRLFCKS